MTTIADVLGWRPADLAAVSDSLMRHRRDLIDLQDDLDGARPPMSWLGDAATSARGRHEEVRRRLLDMVAEVGKVFASVDFGETELTSAQQALEDALSTARLHGFEIDHGTGEVRDPRMYDDEGDRAAAEQHLHGVVRAISDALTAAEAADSDLAAALRSAIDGEVDGGSGGLSTAGSQLPGALEGMSAEEIASRYADDVAMSTITAWIDAEVDVFSFELEGGAEATYVVLGSGEVVMSLHLEGGLGREIDVGQAEAEVSAGLTSDLDLTFASAEEAEAFLEGFSDRAFEMRWYEVGHAPAHIAANVAEYVGEQDITSFRTGVYGQADVEADLGWASGAGSARVDGYYDWVQERFGVSFSAEVEAQAGGAQGEDFGGRAGLTGEAVVRRDGSLEEVTFVGSISGTVANERLGLDLPNGSSGAGADVEIKMDAGNPHFAEFEQATTSGDLDRAAALAMDHGRVVVRTVVIEDYASGEHDITIAGQGVEIEYGANAEVADDVWVRPAGKDYVVPLDPQEIRR